MSLKSILKKCSPVVWLYAEAQRVYYSLLTVISPELNTKARYKERFGKELDLANPKTLNEKILWLKLRDYETNALVRQCADKYAVRNYVREMGCEEILVPMIAAYDSVDEINWDELPDSFAMKWNFGCGFNIICPNKADLDIPATIKKMKKWGRTQYHLPYSEMQYKDVPKKIIVEQYLRPKSGILPEDYKIYCFHGKPYCVMLCADRESGQAKYFFFDREWNFLRINKAGKEAPEGFTVPKVEGIEAAFQYAEKLAEPFPFVRADFYLIDGKVYLGELTFTPGGALDSARLPETDIMFGEMLNLGHSYGGIS